MSDCAGWCVSGWREATPFSQTTRQRLSLLPTQQRVAPQVQLERQHMHTYASLWHCGLCLFFVDSGAVCLRVYKTRSMQYACSILIAL